MAIRGGIAFDLREVWIVGSGQPVNPSRDYGYATPAGLIIKSKRRCYYWDAIELAFAVLSLETQTLSILDDT